MPIYEYSCARCGKTIEVIQKFSDKPLKKHEKCGGTLTKLISASSFHLKGSGWYKDDYVAKPAASESTGAADESSNGKKDKKPETKESKPDTAAEKSTAKSEPAAAPAASEKPSKPAKSGGKKK